jgi:arginyl-tRNA synthetase
LILSIVHLFLAAATAAAMATLSSDGIQALLGGVGVESPIPSFPLADIRNSPMGIYLSYLAEILVQLTECVPQVAYDSIQWPNDMGDLVVVVPRLRFKDVNPNDLAVELWQKVGWHCPDFSCSPSSLSV